MKRAKVAPLTNPQRAVLEWMRQGCMLRRVREDSGAQRVFFVLGPLRGRAATLAMVKRLLDGGLIERGGNEGDFILSEKGVAALVPPARPVARKASTDEVLF